MGPEEEVALKLNLKNRRETVAGVHEVGDELDRTGDKAQRVGREARIGAAGLVTMGKSGRIAGRAAVYGTGAAAAGVVGLGIVVGKFTKDSVKGWEDHTKVVGQTRAVIKSTGGAANLTARQVGGLSDALERKTGVDGDVIQSGANMLLTFKNVRNEQGKGNRIFTRSLATLNDMSVAMGSDASKSAIQLGKALNDPVKGVSALSKVGVTFTDGQRDQIANYVEQNKMADAQKIILRELASEFGGSAKAQMTLGDQVNVGYRQLQDTVGKAVIPLQEKFQRYLINDAIPTAQRYAEVFEKRGVPMIEKYAGIFEKRGIPAIKNFYDEARPVAESILPAIGDGLETTADAVKVIAPRMKAMFDGFNGLPDWAKQAIIIGAGGAAVANKLGAGSLLGKGGLLGNVASIAKPLPVVVTNPGFGVGGKPGVPGAPVPVGGPPKIPGSKVPGFVPPLVNGGLSGLVKVLGLGAAVTYSSKDGVRPGPSKDQIMSDADFRRLVAEKDAYSDWWQAATRATDGITAHTRGVIAGVTQVDNKVDKAKGSTQQLLNVLTGVDKNWRPSLVVDGLDSALVKSNAVRTNLLNLPALGAPGAGLGVLALPGRAGGGPVEAGHPYVVGERRAELFVPKVDGFIHPRVPAMPDVAKLMGVDDDDDARPLVPGRALVVPVILNGREIGAATVEDIEDRLSYL